MDRALLLILSASTFALHSTRSEGRNSERRLLYAPQHFLYFLPLPQGQGSLRPTFSPRTTCCTACISPAPAMRACSSSRRLRRWKASSMSSIEVTARERFGAVPSPPPAVTGTPEVPPSVGPPLL